MENNNKNQELSSSIEDIKENNKKIIDQLEKMKNSGLLGRKTDPLDGVNINEEYDLIQNKKSKLSSMKRKMVCARHAYFQEIEERRLLNKELENESK